VIKYQTTGSDSHSLIYILTLLSLQTSNMTGCHRGPKRKHGAGYRVPSLQRPSYV